MGRPKRYAVTAMFARCVRLSRRPVGADDDCCCAESPATAAAAALPRMRVFALPGDNEDSVACRNLSALWDCLMMRHAWRWRRQLWYVARQNNLSVETPPPRYVVARSVRNE